MGWRGSPSRRRPPLLLGRGDRAVPRDPRLEQAQRLPLAPERRRGLARRDRGLPRAHREGRLARLRHAHPAAPRQRPRALRWLLHQGRPCATSSRSRTASASTSSPRSISPATATRMLAGAAAAPRSGRERALPLDPELSQQLPQPRRRCGLSGARDDPRRALRRCSRQQVLPRRRRRGSGRCLGDVARGEMPCGKD